MVGQPRTAWQNVSFGLCKEEHVVYTEYENFADAFKQPAHWLEVEYMTERIHSALGYLTPAEFEVAVGINQPNPLLIQV